MNMKPFIALAALCLLGSSPAFAASELVCIMTGSVTTATGQPIQDAAVMLTDTRTNQQRVFITPANGRFHFQGIRADAEGHQQVRVTAVDHAPVVFNDVACPMGSAVKGRVVLK